MVNRLKFPVIKKKEKKRNLNLLSRKTVRAVILELSLSLIEAKGKF